MPESEAHWQCILSTGELLLLWLEKSMLDTEEITYVVEGETLQDLIQPSRIGIEFNQIAGPTDGTLGSRIQGRECESSVE